MTTNLRHKRLVWLMKVVALGILWVIPSFIGISDLALILAGLFGVADAIWFAAIFPGTLERWKGLVAGTVLAVIPLYSAGVPVWYLLCRCFPGYQLGVASCRASVIIVGTMGSVILTLMGILSVLISVFLARRRIKRFATREENTK